MKKLDMQTNDLTAANIAKIAKLFPNVITEKEDEDGNVIHAIDFDLLKQELSKVVVDDENERYRLDWPGKKHSLLKANTPIYKTLRPVIEDSKDFENTENLYIEGDNFEVLKVLQESYLNKVKMIYIDPPYNTGKDFIYKDKFTKDKDEYEEEIGAVDEDGNKTFKENTRTNPRYHSDWLSMMYERLIIARDLLKEDGVIFISIDDNEVHNLRKICDEVFGEENFVGDFVWQKQGNDNKSIFSGVKTFRNDHESIIVYSRNKITIEFNRPEEESKFKNDYGNADNDPRGNWMSAELGKSDARSLPHGKNYYTLSSPNGIKWTRQWHYDEKEMKDLISDNKVYFGKDGGNVPRLKKFLNEKSNKIPSSLLINKGSTKVGQSELDDLFDRKEMFSYPKPTLLIKYLMELSTISEDIILDFFSGSATTAHAVMKLNAEDGGNRKFIMVQLPEETGEDSEAYKAGYKNICEIGKERIRRAGEKIKTEELAKLELELAELEKEMKQTKLVDTDEIVNKKKELEEKIEHIKTLDIGFRVYRVDSSNMRDVYYHPSKLDQSELDDLISNIKEDRTPEDLLTQVMLDLGLKLDLPIEEKTIKGNRFFVVEKNSLVACFDDGISLDIVDEIAKLKPLKVVFKDGSFKDDKDRINVETRFQRASAETEINVI